MEDLLLAGFIVFVSGGILSWVAVWLMLKQTERMQNKRRKSSVYSKRVKKYISYYEYE